MNYSFHYQILQIQWRAGKNINGFSTIQFAQELLPQLALSALYTVQKLFAQDLIQVEIQVGIQV